MTTITYQIEVPNWVTQKHEREIHRVMLLALRKWMLEMEAARRHLQLTNHTNMRRIFETETPQ